GSERYRGTSAGWAESSAANPHGKQSTNSRSGSLCYSGGAMPLSYPEFIERLKRDLGHDRAMEAAVGRHFDPVGEVLRAFLIQNGLLPQHYLIDVGCGAGRLAKHLAHYFSGTFLGTHVLPALVPPGARAL